MTFPRTENQGRKKAGEEGADPEVHQKMLDRQLDLAFRGSDSLNGRGTTLSGLLGATIALVGTASVRAVGSVDQMPYGSLIVTAMGFVIGLSALAICIVIALTAVRPSRESTERLQTIVEQLMWDVFDERRVRQSTWLALQEQRSANKRKSELIRVAYLLAWIGISAIVISIGVFCFSV